MRMVHPSQLPSRLPRLLLCQMRPAARMEMSHRALSLDRHLCLLGERPSKHESQFENREFVDMRNETCQTAAPGYAVQSVGIEMTLVSGYREAVLNTW